MPRLSSRRRQLPYISPGLMVIVSFYAAGICWAEEAALPDKLVSISALLLLCVLLVRNSLKAKQNPVFSYFLLALLFYLLGLLQYNGLQATPPGTPHHIYNLITNKQTVSLEGVLQKYPSVINGSSGPETRLLMQVKGVHRPEDTAPSVSGITRASGLVLLTLQGVPPEELKPGDCFLVQADVSRVSTYSTPGAFNYKKYLAERSIFIKGWIQAPHTIIKLQTAESFFQTEKLTTLLYLPERLRHTIADFIGKTLQQPARGLYKAILIGDRNDVPPQVIESFTAAGCIHILAISGMHMGLLALVIIAVLTWVLKRSTWLLLHAPVLKIAVALSLPPLLIYALIAGFNIPILRALLMTVVLTLAILFDRPGNLLNHIILAAFFILAWKPAALFTASFQLSFSAVIAIAIIYPLVEGFLLKESREAPSLSAVSDSTIRYSAIQPVQKIARGFLKWLLAGVTLTTAAMLGTFPLLLFHFNRFSLVAPISNLLVEPLVCLWALIIGLAGSLCIPLMPALAKVLFAAGSYGLVGAVEVCSFFSALPYTSLWLPTPSPIEILLVYLVLFSSVSALHTAGRARRYALLAVLCLLCSLPALSIFSTKTEQAPGTAAVTFLDVGHGSSILLHLPENRNILIDGGGAQSDRFNIGKQVIAPFLWEQKIKRLDAVVITHSHADHYNGLPFILARFRPKVLWVNGISSQDREYRKLLEQAAELGIETRIAEAGQLLFQADGTRLLCIHSGGAAVYKTERLRQTGSLSQNDRSIVLRLETGDRAFLFPADISAALAEQFVQEGRLLQADVLMAPHHGSPSSMSLEFIRSVDPRYIAISAGRNNPFNFPDTSFYDLQQTGIEILSTGRDGTIGFHVENGEMLPDTYQVN